MPVTERENREGVIEMIKQLWACAMALIIIVAVAATPARALTHCATGCTTSCSLCCSGVCTACCSPQGNLCGPVEPY